MEQFLAQFGSVRNILWAFFFAIIVWFTALEETSDTKKGQAILQITPPEGYEVEYTEFRDALPIIGITLSGPKRQMDRVGDLDQIQAEIRLTREQVQEMELGEVQNRPLTREHFKLPSTEIAVETIVPSSITFIVRKLVRAQRPVRPNIVDQERLAPGYIVDTENIVIEPNLVTVRGPKEALEAIDAVLHTPVSVAGRAEEVIKTGELAILPRNGCQSRETVRVTIPIVPVPQEWKTSLPYVITVQDIDTLPYKFEPQGFKDEVTVTFVGHEKEIARLKERAADIVAEVFISPSQFSESQLREVKRKIEAGEEVVPESFPVRVRIPEGIEVEQTIIEVEGNPAPEIQCDIKKWGGNTE